MSKKLTYEQVKLFIEEQGHVLLSTEYKNCMSKLKVQCPLGHEFEMTYNNFKKGYGCSICSGNKKKTYKYIKSYIKSFNYKLLSIKYKNNHTKLKLQCPEGHIFKMSYKHFKRGQRCPFCFGKIKLSYNHVKEYIESFNYKLLSTTYKNHGEKLKLQCLECKNEYMASFNNFKRGKRCPFCYYNSTSSKPEKELQEFVSTIYDGIITLNDRSIIINPLTGHNLELDIFLPELNKAIEFNGSYWHSKPKAIKYDKIKQEQCKYNNIILLSIHEDNWTENKEICLKVIENFIKL